MTRNQLLPNYVKNWSGGVMFTVDGSGNITPTAQQNINRGETILTQPDPACNTTFSGHVCARQNDVCQCSTLVGVSSGSHMAIGTGYTISSSVTVGSNFEIYAVTDSGPVASATNGNIHINS
ncbi:MAG TPA: hypothetical protein VF516_26840 [Kofleriaceae bacterium]